MANKNAIPPKKAQWKKGQSGNPSGRPAEPPELKHLKLLTKQELVEVANLVIKGDVDTLLALRKDKKQSVIKVMVASVAARIIMKGDMQALDVLLNRLVGKVKDEFKFEGEVRGKVIVQLPSNGREAKVSRCKRKKT